MELSPDQITHFQEKILTWYQANKRDLPWRRTRNPYAILVSEVMLQQTQVSRVIPKYEAWMERFPTLDDLAAAPLAEVLRYWSGLGYNRRALNVQKAAKTLVTDYHGRFPTTGKELEALPGIGKYTAAAVACFAFDQQIAVVDTNIRKVITTAFFSGVLPPEKVIEEVASQLIPQGHAYDWNQALMDYSSLMLKKEKIPIPKQSRFHGSDRYYRGQTLKLLLSKRDITLRELQVFFQNDHPISSERLEHILRGMIQDSFLVRKGEKYVLANQ